MINQNDSFFYVDLLIASKEVHQSREMPLNLSFAICVIYLLTVILEVTACVVARKSNMYIDIH